MSRAFVREGDSDGAGELPELPLSEHPNYVTPHGLTLLRERLDQTRRRLAAIDPGTKGASREIGHVEREQRWLQARVMTAISPAVPATEDRVGFGATIDLFEGDGRVHRYRIVGEDEADPAHGSVSHVSPLARALMGKHVGDTALLAGAEVEIVAVG